MQNSTFVSDAEIDRLLLQAAKWLFDQLVKARGQEYYTKTDTIDVVPQLVDYELADDFYQVLSVIAVFGPGDTPGLEPYAIKNAAQLASSVGPPYKYRLRGVQSTEANAAKAAIRILPPPTQAFTLWVEYIPTCSLVATTDDEDVATTIIDGINGWEDACVWRTVATLLAMEESDASFALSMLAMETDRIASLASSRDAGSPEAIVDARYGDAPW